MKNHRQYLKQKLRDQKFRKIFEEERLLAEISLRIYEMREKLNLSQNDLAKRAMITQQQLSKIENGINCNLTTFLKVCQALGLTIDLKPGNVELQIN